MDKKEAEIKEVISRAVESGSYMIAAFRFKDGMLDLDRISADFPFGQFKTAAELLKQNLAEEMAGNGEIDPRSSLAANGD